MKKEKEFKKQLVWFDKQSYSEAVNKGNFKLFAINDALKWCEDKINTDLIDRKKFMLNMRSEFLRCLKDANKGKIQLDISAEKIASLLDISVAPLLEFQQTFDKYDFEVIIIGEIYNVDVDKELYKRYTRNEKENEALSTANELISALKKVEKHRTIRPAFIQQAFQQFIRWDFRDNVYRYNIDYR